MPTILITGTSRGIGLELARQYAEAGWQVIATVRDPTRADRLQALAREYPGISVETLDVAERAQAVELRARLEGRAIDVLLHNAGIAPGTREQSTFGSLDYELGEVTLRTNLWSVLRITECLLDNVLRSEQRKVMVISSAVGTVSSVARFEGASGGGYLYRISKAALNMAIALLAKDLAMRGVTVGLLSPGQVDTDLGGGHIGTPASQLVPVERSVGGLMAVIESFSLAKTGRFIRHNGAEVPW